MSRGFRRAVVGLVALALLGVVPAPALAASRASRARQLRGLAIREQNSSLRYLHTTWFNANYQYETVPIASITEATGTADTSGTIELLRPPGGFSPKSSDPGGGAQLGLSFEPATTGASLGSTARQASTSYATALALANGTYNPGRVGVSSAEALRRVVAWNNALALSHVRAEWGRNWQSGLWAYYLGASSIRVWGSIPDCTKQLVTKSVADEANRLLKIPPPFYRDAKGKIIYPGDSKAEENAWNASLLFLAARMFSSGDATTAAKWEAQARCYALSAYATPNQVGIDPRITGSNLNADGTLVNHGIIHPDYMATAGEMETKYVLVSAWSQTPLAPECQNRFTTVWSGLTKVKFRVGKYRKPGGTIYRAGKRGVATTKIYYPQGTDWSPTRRQNMALMDVAIFVAGHDYSYGWANAHLNYVLRQQARHKDGRVFSPGETRYTDEEQFAAACAAEMSETLRRVR